MIKYTLPQVMNCVQGNIKDAEVQLETKGERWLRYQRQAIKQGFGRNMLVVGEPGSGKSWACLRLAEKLDLNGFHAGKVAFNSEQFLEKINTAKKGDCIVYEEVGVNISNRQWWKQFGQNAILQTVRHKNLFIIMNCPNVSFLDKPVIKLVHYTFGMQRMNQKEGYTVMRPMRLRTDGQFSNMKMLFPMIDGVLITEMIMSKPTVQLRHAYEKESRAYKNSLSKRYLDEERAAGEGV